MKKVFFTPCGAAVVLPQKTKTEKRRSVYGITLLQGKILLACSKISNKMEFPDGKVECGETLKQALEREFVEETGWKVKVGRLIATQSDNVFMERENKFFESSIRYCAVEPIEKKGRPVDTAEVSQTRRVPTVALNEKNLAWIHFTALNRLLAKLG